MASPRLLKSSDLWTHFRPPFREWTKRAGFRRLASSPPAYTRELERGVLTLFGQASRGGVDPQVGGEFTFALQVGERAMPGVAFCAGVDLRTDRVCELFTPAQREEALAIHNAVVAKRAPPPPSSYLRQLHGAALDARFLLPLSELPANDYWMAFVDADDARAWGEYVVRHLDGWLHMAVEKTAGRFGPL